MTSRTLVWDLPTRLFHWLLVACFFGAYLLSGKDDWLPVHVVLGATVFGLIVFRLIWGLMGTRYARFASFAFGWRDVSAYLRSLLRGTPQHYVGHNPAGAWAIYTLLGLGLATTAMGYAALTGPDWSWLLDVHQVLGNLMLTVIGIHIAGVAVSSLLHRENLPRAMITGEKRARRPEEGIRSSVWIVGALLTALVAGFWVAAWLGDVPALTKPAAAFQARHHAHGRDN